MRKDPIRRPGIYLIVNDVAPDLEDEFNRWYQQQHLPERLAIRGFRTARRYYALGARPAYMAVYECDSLEVLSSAAYKERVANPSEWTRKIMPAFRNVLRSACRETLSYGCGVGAMAIMVQCKPLEGKEALARDFIRTQLAPRLMQSGGLVRMSLWETDTAVTGMPSSESALRNDQENYPHWVLFLESYDMEKAALTLHTEILACEVRKSGLLFGTWARYQLICGLNLSQGR